MAQPAEVVFDGTCSLCSDSVRFLRRRARPGQLSFVASQDAQATLDEQETVLVRSTLIVRIQGRRFLRSAGVVRALLRLRGAWPVVGVLLWLIPLPLRNLGYRFIARRRHQLKS